VDGWDWIAQVRIDLVINGVSVRQGKKQQIGETDFIFPWPGWLLELTEDTGLPSCARC
jgi:hypothetical protein